MTDVDCGAGYTAKTAAADAVCVGTHSADNVFDASCAPSARPEDLATCCDG